VHVLCDACIIHACRYVRACVMADCTWQRVAANPDRENITFFTFEISIIGRVKNTTDLDPPRLSAADPICFLPKKLTHE
jgi:hypothetical protein